MTIPAVLRTPDDRFEGLADWPHPPRYWDWNGVRVHHVDVGEGPIVLLIHGEPDWGYMYRDTIRVLTAAGYRCIAPDFIGFGRSDKVVDDSWYTPARHMEMLGAFIRALDLREVVLVVHDWGGPIGLRQLVDMPERFARTFILNTWLHHDGFAYSEGIRQWRAFAVGFPPGTGDLPAGRIMQVSRRTPHPDPDAIGIPYDAPFPDPSFKAGIRRFPTCLPFAEPDLGAAAEQQRLFDALGRWSGCPVHLIFGDADPIFDARWGRAFAGHIPGATFETIAGPGHFVAEERGAEVAERMLVHLRA